MSAHNPQTPSNAQIQILEDAADELNGLRQNNDRFGKGRFQSSNSIDALPIKTSGSGQMLNMNAAV